MQKTFFIKDALTLHMLNSAEFRWNIFKKFDPDFGGALDMTRAYKQLNFYIDHTLEELVELNDTRTLADEFPDVFNYLYTLAFCILDLYYECKCDNLNLLEKDMIHWIWEPLGNPYYNKPFNPEEVGELKLDLHKILFQVMQNLQYLRMTFPERKLHVKCPQRVIADNKADLERCFNNVMLAIVQFVFNINILFHITTEEFVKALKNKDQLIANKMQVPFYGKTN